MDYSSKSDSRMIARVVQTLHPLSLVVRIKSQNSINTLQVEVLSTWG
jgi:hypothetical protein